MKIKINDLVTETSILENKDYLEIKLGMAFKDDKGESARKIGIVINDLAKKYKAKVEGHSCFFYDNNTSGYYYDKNIYTCTFIGENKEYDSKLFLLDLKDLTYDTEKLYPIKTYFHEEKTDRGYRIQVSVYNTITEEICKEINTIIEEFKGIELHSWKAVPHEYITPETLNVYFSTQEAAYWFYHTIKLIEKMY